MPGIESSLERKNLLETMIEQYLRRTGARPFVLSSTISYYDLILRQLIQSIFQVMKAYSFRARNEGNQNENYWL